MKCSSCGMEFEGVFCPNCGTKNDMPDAVHSAQDSGAALKQNATLEIPRQPKDVLGVLALISGIIGICTFGVFFIPDVLAIIFGILCKQDGKRSGIGKAGLVCGIISAGIFVLLMIIAIMMES